MVDGLLGDVPNCGAAEDAEMPLQRALKMEVKVVVQVDVGTVHA